MLRRKVVFTVYTQHRVKVTRPQRSAKGVLCICKYVEVCRLVMDTKSPEKRVRDIDIESKLGAHTDE